MNTFRRGCRDYREGLAEAIDRYNAGQSTTGAVWAQLIKRPAQKCDRLMKRLWARLGAEPVHGP